MKFTGYPRHFFNLLRRVHWLAWLAGSIVLWALTYQNAADSLITSASAVAEERSAVRIGWPIVFLWKPANVPFTADSIYVPALLTTLLICGFILIGTMLSVQSLFGGVACPERNLRTLGVLIVSTLAWYLLFRRLIVPIYIFLAWASLAIVYLSIPFVAHSVVGIITRMQSRRFSISTMMAVVTIICLVAGYKNWEHFHRRMRRQGTFGETIAVSVDPASVQFGIMKPKTTLKDGVVPGDYKLVESTRAIPCTLNTTFGVEYKIAGESLRQDGKLPKGVTITRIWKYRPFKEHINQSNSNEEKLTESTWLAFGERDVSVIQLGNASNLKSGEWSFQLWYGSPGDPQTYNSTKLLLTQFFKVRSP